MCWVCVCGGGVSIAENAGVGRGKGVRTRDNACTKGTLSHDQNAPPRLAAQGCIGFEIWIRKRALHPTWLPAGRPCRTGRAPCTAKTVMREWRWGAHEARAKVCAACIPALHRVVNMHWKSMGGQSDVQHPQYNTYAQTRHQGPPKQTPRPACAFLWWCAAEALSYSASACSYASLARATLAWGLRRLHVNG